MKKKIKIIAIISSPHKNGFSAKLTRECVKVTEKLGAKTEELYLPDYKVKFCQGCMKCLSGRECILDDELNFLREKLENADGFIISSPTYGLQPNAIMINFLQRIGIYAVYRSSLAEKYVVGISTAGAIGAKKVAKSLTEFTDGLFKLGYRTGFLGANVGDGVIAQKDIKKSRKLGVKIFNDIQSGKEYKLQKIFTKLIGSLVIRRLMKKNLQNNKENGMKGVYEYVMVKNII